MPPLVSVILPTRNRSRLLGRAIASVLGQSVRDLELIVVNDASTDETADLLARIDDPRLRCLHREKNSGAAAARNAGIAVACGRWVAFQDDDDYWLSEKLEKQLQALNARPGTAWCLASYIRQQKTRDDYIGGSTYFSQLDYDQGLGADGPDWSLIATPGWLVQRDLLMEVGCFDESIRSWDDWELGLRLWQRAGPPAHADGPLWCQDWIEGQGLMRLERARGDDMRVILNKHAARWATNSRALAHHWYTIGRAASLFEPAPAGRTELWRALRHWPLYGRAWAAMVLAKLGQERAQRFTMRFRKLRENLRS